MNTMNMRNDNAADYVTTSLALEEKQHTALKVMSARTGVPMAAHVRLAVKNYLDEKGGDSDV